MSRCCIQCGQGTFVPREQNGPIICPPCIERHTEFNRAKGGTKHDNGKPSLSYIPRCFLVGISKVMAYGAKKYAKYNYTKGFDESRVLDAVLRHIFAHLAGEDLDPESGEPHLMHAAAGLLMHTHCKELGTLVDDRFTKETA